MPELLPKPSTMSMPTARQPSLIDPTECRAIRIALGSHADKVLVSGTRA